MLGRPSARLARDAHERRQHRRHRTLHVARPAAIDATVANSRLEGVHRHPLDAHRVLVDLPQQRVAATAGDQGEEIGPPGSTGCRPHAPARLGGESGEPLGDALLPRLGRPRRGQPRVDARLGDQLTKQVDDASRHAAPSPAASVAMAKLSSRQRVAIWARNSPGTVCIPPPQRIHLAFAWDNPCAKHPSAGCCPTRGGAFLCADRKVVSSWEGCKVKKA